MTDKKLLRNVVIDGTLYGPDGKEPTAEVLEQITNPSAFEAKKGNDIRSGVEASEVEKASGQGGDGDSGDGDDGELKGKALDEALAAAGLAKSGTVAEKRARLKEYQDAADADAGS